MTNKKKNKIMELAYDLAFELENSLDDKAYDHILDNGGRPSDTSQACQDIINAISSLKTA